MIKKCQSVFKKLTQLQQGLMERKNRMYKKEHLKEKMDYIHFQLCFLQIFFHLLWTNCLEMLLNRLINSSIKSKINNLFCQESILIILQHLYNLICQNNTSQNQEVIMEKYMIYETIYIHLYQILLSMIHHINIRIKNIRIFSFFFFLYPWYVCT